MAREIDWPLDQAPDLECAIRTGDRAKPTVFLPAEFLLEVLGTPRVLAAKTRVVTEMIQRMHAAQ